MSAGALERSRDVESPLWRTVALGLALVITVSWFSAPIYLATAQRWGEYTYSHGYLVLVLSVIMLVRRVRGWSPAEAKTSALGFGALACTLLAVVAAQAGSVLLGAQVLLPAVWLTAIWAVFGPALAKRAAVPFAYFLFAVPVWDVLTPILQYLTVTAVTALLRLIDLPVHMDGDLIYVPAGVFEVAGGCSGLSFVIVALALALFGNAFFETSLRSALVLAASALGVALVANWARVTALVLVGQATNMQHYLIVEDHYYFGWGVFLVFLTPWVLLGRRLQHGAPPASRPAPQRVSFDRPRPARAAAVTTLCGVFACFGLAVWLNDRLESPFAMAGADFELPPVPGWNREIPWGVETRPSFPGADTEIGYWYSRNGGRPVGVYLARYGIQRQGHEAVSDNNRPLGPADRVAATRSARVGVRGERDEPLIEFLAEGNGTPSRIVWMQWRIAGVTTASAWVAKALQIQGAFGGRRDASVLVLSADCGANCEQARRQLTDLYSSLRAPLYGCLDRKAGESRANVGGRCSAN